MTVGPVQVIIFGFDRTDQFRGEVLEELANLRGRGLIRLIDLFLAVKDASGEVIAVEMNDLTEEESVEFGKVIGKLLGVSECQTPEMQLPKPSKERWLPLPIRSVWITRDLRQVVEEPAAGKAFGVLMFEHTWAIPLRDAIRRAGGVPLAQGFITPEALVMVGEELQAIAEAETHDRGGADRAERGHPGYAGHPRGSRGDQDRHRCGCGAHPGNGRI